MSRILHNFLTYFEVMPNSRMVNQRIDLDTRTSDRKGFSGLFEKLLRRFRSLMHGVSMIPVYFAGCVLMGSCFVPGIYLFQFIKEWSADYPLWVQNFATGFSFVAGFFLYGISLIFLAPLTNFLLRTKLHPWRGPYYSAETFNWFIHNAITYLARFTCLEFFTPSPLSNLFYKMMGMKIGHGVVINTTWISDPALIEIGDKVTIGGSATIVAHYGQNGLLVIAPVKIGTGCTIGLKAVIMGGVTIGDGAKVMPLSVVMPNTIIPAGETWGGVPARKIEKPSSLEIKAA